MKRKRLAAVFLAMVLLSIITAPMVKASAGDSALAEVWADTAASEDEILEATSTVSSGTCGDTLNWVLEDDGTLTISGSGSMTDWDSAGDTPWYSNRSSIKRIVLPSGLTSIGKCAFGSCSSLTAVTIPDSVTSIGYKAFYLCKYLSDVTIPADVTSIGDGSFGACSRLSAISVAEGNTAYCSVDGVLFNKGKTKLIQYPAGKSSTSYRIPDSVVILSSLAFVYSANLTSITIPDGMTSIDFGSFGFCTSLVSITIPGSVTTIGDLAFGGCCAMTKATVLSKSVTIGTQALGYNSYEEKVNGFTLIGYSGSTAQSYAENNGFSFEVYKGKTDLSSCTVTLSETTYDYDGCEKEPTVTVKHGSTTLTRGGDYTVSYIDNINAGTATAEVTGAGNYSGTKKVTFTINKAKNVITAGDFKKTYSSKAQSFSIRAGVLGKAKLSYSSSSNSITVDSKGKVTIKKKYIGSATITITAKKTTNYKAATKKITVTVKPAKMSVKKITTPKKKWMKVTWKKAGGGVSGYQIELSTSTDFSNAGPKNIRFSKTSLTISGLKSKKKYYVRLRSYKKVGGKIYSGAWSDAKGIRVK